MMKKYILSLDEGTTSARAILFDKNGNIDSSAHREFTQLYPRPGYGEQPGRLLISALSLMRLPQLALPIREKRR